MPTLAIYLQLLRDACMLWFSYVLMHHQRPREVEGAWRVEDAHWHPYVIVLRVCKEHL